MCTENIELTLRVEDISGVENPVVAIFQQTSNLNTNSPQLMADIAAQIWNKHQITVYLGDECSQDTRLSGCMNGFPQHPEDYVEVTSTDTTPLIEYSVHRHLP